MKMSCENCPYANPKRTTKPSLECRRRAPQPSREFADVLFFPIVSRDEWCGEHPAFADKVQEWFDKRNAESA